MYAICILNTLLCITEKIKCHGNSEGIPVLTGQLYFTTVQIPEGSPTK